MALIQSTAIPSGATGYDIPYSCRFNGADSADLSRTFTATGNRKTWTFSCWVKRGTLGRYQDRLFSCYQANDSPLSFYFNSANNLAVANWADEMVKTTEVYRDTSAWYHVMLALDTTQSTASNRAKIYVNGVQQATVAGGAGYPGLNLESFVNLTGQNHRIGSLLPYANDQFYNGYLGEVNFIDGATKVPADFGETGTYGEWKPIEYSGSYGTNGFYLNFATASDMGDDKSSNTNDWAENNIAATDQMLDSPTNNFATLNAVDKWGSTMTLSEGNLKQKEVTSTYGSYTGVRASMAFPSTGKWYIEYNELTSPASTGGIGGFRPVTGGQNMQTNGDYAGTGGKIGYVNATGLFFAATSVSFSAGDILMFAYDSENGKTWLGKNGTWISSGNPSTAANPVIFNEFAQDTFFGLFSRELEGVVNFGQDSSFAGNKTAQGNQDGNDIGDFYYAPPTGFLALCTKNLPDVAVVPSEHFNTVLYTGTGAVRSITGVGFQSDLTWAKVRSSAGTHVLTDSVRGGNKQLFSNLTNSEASATNKITGFISDGFTLGADDGTGTGDANFNGATYTAWNWKANGSGSSNTNGSITSSVSANVDAGFSIVSYTGTGAAATVGHGLSKAPELIITKNKTGYNWGVYNYISGATKYLYLNTTAAVGTYQHYWNNTEPTSSVFSVGTDVVSNGHTHGMIAYAFHSVDGYSKVGSYTGNGNADGTFIYTGFRPAYVMIKRTDGVTHWQIHDTARDTSNVMGYQLHANANDADASASAYYIDSVSNGFKLRMSHAGQNASGGTYIYIAFAESPFKYSNAR